MSHTALARQYRPRRFAEVSTQSHVSETLRRAVATGRVGHAYLFCGPRGVGKTTLARVLAMALNCPNRTDDGEPCGSCESCTRIWSGHTALDVVEIDAASNRGVDDARDLRERAMYAPSGEGRYKVYILDEAHMLTREAWNALLKVLEEPPPRVIFVFATTEPGKIERAAAPILSRCQRFDFRRIGLDDIVDRLSEVIQREGGRAAPEEALRAIARRAEGGMRDALSILDQVIALTDGQVEQDAVRRVLGIVADDRYHELLGIIAERRHSELFTFIDTVVSEGYDLVEFHHGFVESIRELLRGRLAGDDLHERGFPAAATRFSTGDLLRMLRISSDLDASGQLRRTGHPRLLIEILLLQLSHLDRTVELAEVLSAVRSGGGAGGGGGTGDAGDRSQERVVRSEGEVRAQERSQVDSRARTGEVVRTGDGVRAEDEGRTREGVRAEDEVRTAEGARAEDEVLVSTQVRTDGQVRSEREIRAVETLDQPDSSTGELALVPAWHRLVEERRGLPPGLSPLLRAAEVHESAPGVLSLSLPPGPVRERLEDPAVRAALSRGLRELSGRAVELRLEGDPAAPDPGSRVTPEEVREGRIREEIRREPLLARAVEELDLEPMD